MMHKYKHEQLFKQVYFFQTVNNIYKNCLKLKVRKRQELCEI